MTEEFIVTVTLPGTPERFNRVGSGTITVGRSPDADIQLAHPLVSRQHAQLSLQEDGSFVVRDLNSRNGTVVNDEPLQDASRVVQGRAVLQVGPYLLHLTTQSEADAETFSAARPPQQPAARVTLDRDRRLLLVDGVVTLEGLTGLEFQLVDALTAAGSRLISNQELADAVWGAGRWDAYMLHNLVRRVRRKLELKGLNADQIIVGVPRAGYRVA